MKLHVIAVFEPSNDVPWVVNAWDEWTIDENPPGFTEAVEKAKRENPRAEVRVGVIRVPDSFLNDLFKPTEVKGEVVKPLVEKDPYFCEKHVCRATLCGCKV
jgi:hypothetical protein